MFLVHCLWSRAVEMTVIFVELRIKSNLNDGCENINKYWTINFVISFCPLKKKRTSNTANEAFERIESKMSYTVANAFKYDKWHSMIVSRNHNTLNLTEEQLKDMFRWVIHDMILCGLLGCGQVIQNYLLLSWFPEILLLINNTIKKKCEFKVVSQSERYRFERPVSTTGMGCDAKVRRKSSAHTPARKHGFPVVLRCNATLARGERRILPGYISGLLRRFPTSTQGTRSCLWTQRLVCRRQPGQSSLSLFFFFLIFF